MHPSLPAKLYESSTSPPMLRLGQLKCWPMQYQSCGSERMENLVSLMSSRPLTSFFEQTWLLPQISMKPLKRSPLTPKRLLSPHTPENLIGVSAEPTPMCLSYMRAMDAVWVKSALWNAYLAPKQKMPAPQVAPSYSVWMLRFFRDESCQKLNARSISK